MTSVPSRREQWLLVVAAFLLSTVLTACGDADGQTGPGGGPGAMKLNVGVVPVADYAPLSYALAMGYFAQEGLDVTLQPLQGGAAAVPGVLSGDLQVSVTSWVSFVRAIDAGLDLRAFHSGAVAKPHYSALYVGDSSPVTSTAQLAGKTVAVAELKTVAELTTIVALEEAGVDADSVTFTQIPLDAIVPAVDKGAADAGWLVEPFISQAKSSRQVEVLDVYSGELEGMSIGGYIVSGAFAASSPDALRGFSAALTKAAGELNADPLLLRREIAGFSALVPEQEAAVQLPTFGGPLSRSDVQDWADLMAEHDFISGRVSVADRVIDAGK